MNAVYEWQEVRGETTSGEAHDKRFATELKDIDLPRVIASRNMLVNQHV